MKLKRTIVLTFIISLLLSINFLKPSSFYYIKAEEQATMKVLVTEEEWENMDKGLKQIRLELPNQGTLFYKDSETLKEWETEINKQNYKYTNIIAQSVKKHPNEYQTTKKNCSPDKDVNMILILNKKCATNIPSAKKLIQESVDQSANNILDNSLSITRSIQTLGQTSGPRVSKIDVILMILGPASLILIIYLYLKKIKF